MANYENLRQIGSGVDSFLSNEVKTLATSAKVIFAAGKVVADSETVTNARQAWANRKVEMRRERLERSLQRRQNERNRVLYARYGNRTRTKAA